jgi:AcrR family transcriptional regulator
MNSQVAWAVMSLDKDVGRLKPLRTDSRDTRARLIAAVGEVARIGGATPTRLVDVALAAEISPATAYRHFASAEEVVTAYVFQLPELAAARFHQRDRSGDALDRFRQWNQAWVHACLAFGPSAVALRSSEGFLARRRRGEPVVSFVCGQVEPLLKAVATDVTAALVVWNAVSDPREVLDMHVTLRWSRVRIAEFVTQTTIRSVDP